MKIKLGALAMLSVAVVGGLTGGAVVMSTGSGNSSGSSVTVHHVDDTVATDTPTTDPTAGAAPTTAPVAPAPTDTSSTAPTTSVDVTPVKPSTGTSTGSTSTSSTAPKATTSTDTTPAPAPVETPAPVVTPKPECTEGDTRHMALQGYDTRNRVGVVQPSGGIQTCQGGKWVTTTPIDPGNPGTPAPDPMPTTAPMPGAAAASK